jgi:hypothetical protein
MYEELIAIIENNINKITRIVRSKIYAVTTLRVSTEIETDSIRSQFYLIT